MAGLREIEDLKGQDKKVSLRCIVHIKIPSLPLSIDSAALGILFYSVSFLLMGGAAVVIDG
jgi:hypothetical protein